jgi:hypothetical protein
MQFICLASSKLGQLAIYLSMLELERRRVAGMVQLLELSIVHQRRLCLGLPVDNGVSRYVSHLYAVVDMLA